MSVKKNKAYQYIISNIRIKGNLISWEDHAIWTSGISQIWVGKMPSKPFPIKILFLTSFIALSSQHIINMIVMLALLAIGSAMWFYCHGSDKTAKHVNIKLYSGNTISFTSNHEETVSQFYEVLNGLAEGNQQEEIVFDKYGKLVEKVKEEKTEEAEGVKEEPLKSASFILDASKGNTPQELLMGDLKKLYLRYEEKTEDNSQTLTLIDEIAQYISAGDRPKLKKALEKLVMLGLIVDCNELGLHSLLQEIKQSLY